MATPEKLPRPMVIAYAVPSIGIMWTQILFTNYFFKYSVDVLLVAPATIGWVLLVTRLWDAVSDPVVGFLTDATRSSAGRRRPWVFASAIPVALSGFLMWNPPVGLSQDLLVLWMFLAVLVWETAMTALFVPYMALGSEVSMNHHDRTRVAGYRHVFGGAGQLCVIGSVYLLTASESPRETAFWLLIGGGALAASLKMVGIWFVRENAVHAGRGSRHPLHAVRDVFSNPHLLRLVAIYFFEITSVAAIGLLASFVCQYVIGRAAFFPALLLVFQLSSYLSTPVVVTAARRFGKKTVWIGTVLVQAGGFAATFFIGTGDELYALACITVVGLGSAGGTVLGMSILADVVDYDEYRSGERKEALHYAAINIARKVSFASVTAFVGVAMEGIGFEPNADQTADALAGLSALFAGIPAVALVVSAGLLWSFGLTGEEHARVRAALDVRLVQANRDRLESSRPV